MSALRKALSSAARREVQVGRGASITVLQHFMDTPVPQRPQRRADLTGLKLWPCALRLLARLDSTLLPQLRAQLQASDRPLRVLELGSGTGVLGMGLAALGEQVLLTDPAAHVRFAVGEDDARCDTLAWLGANVEENSAALSDRAQVAPLLWGDEGHMAGVEAAHAPFDLVVGSDLLYDPDQYACLTATLQRFSGPRTLAVLGFSHRHGGEERFLRSAERAFHVRTCWFPAEPPSPRWAIAQLLPRRSETDAASGSCLELCELDPD